MMQNLMKSTMFNSSREACTGQDWLTRQLEWPDYLVFSAVLLVSVSIGVFYGFISKKKQTTTAAFLMGNRQMSYWTLFISLAVGFTSAISVLGNAAEMYNFGTQFMTSMAGFIAMVPCSILLLLPVFRELGITSIYEYLDRRFNNLVRLLVAFLYLLQHLMYIAVVVYAPALALRQMTGIGTMYAVAIIFTVAILYSSMGGLKAVVWSDVFLACIMLATLIMIVVRGSMTDGGPDVIWKYAYDSDRIEFLNFDFDPRVRHTVFSTVIGASFYWGGLSSATQTIMQRLLSLPSQRDAWIAMIMCSCAMFVIFSLTFYIGLMTYAHFHTCDPLLSKSINTSDQLLPLYVMEIAGSVPGLPGLFVAGVFSASLSTVASALNSVSASILRDILGGGFGYHPPEARATLVSRILSIAFGLACFALTFLVAELGGVLQIAISFNGMMIGVVLAVFMLGMYTPWSNTKGTLVGALTGLAIIMWLGMGAQVEIMMGRLVHPQKEVGLDCECDVVLPPEVPLDEVFDGYRISYFWYSPLGWLITIVTGMIASALLGGKDPEKLDPKLLAPIIRKMFIKRHGAAKLKSETVEENRS